MNNPDHISENNFWVTIHKFFDAVPGWKKFGSRIGDGKNSNPGSGIEKFGSGMEKIRIRD
jgi:hypothetical protein